MKRFISILQFMTRIPINIDTGFDEEFHKTITYFPLVGLVLGVLIYIIGLVSGIFFDSFITSIIVTLALVILTGGLHIDGLGDTFDAIYSYRDKERMLEIMKDSRLGTNSLLAIMFLILLKIGFIYSIINNSLLWTVIFMNWKFIYRKSKYINVYYCYTIYNNINNRNIKINILSFNV